MDFLIIFILYLLTFSNGKQYVGQTNRSLKTRINQHKNSSKSNSKLAVHNAWRKYGQPIVDVIGEYNCQDELHLAEIKEIKDRNTLSPFGYNLGLGGETAPSKNPSVAKKISEKAKGRKYSSEFKNTVKENSLKNWQDEEYRKKVSDGLKKSWTDERKKQRSEQMKASAALRKAQGKTQHSEETKLKIKESKKNISEETRRKMSQSAKARGVNHGFSEETRKKISDSAKKQWKDDETRRLMSENISKALKAKSII